jgi:extracellular solute-binding protein/VWA domain-containing protein
MSGRHSKPSSGRRGVSLPVIVGALLLAAACVAVVVVFVTRGGGSGHNAAANCSGKVNIVVDAAPSIAEPVQTIANRWLETNPNAEGKCIDVNVTALPSSNEEQILAAGGNGSGESASMWIPDSSTWATRLNDDLTGAGRNSQVEVHAPIAVSPLVFVSSPSVVSKFISKPDWRNALAGAFPLTIPDPVSNTDGLLSLQIMNSLVGSKATGPDPQLANLMLRLSHATLPDANAGFAQLAADPSHAPVFTAPEQTVIQANRAKQSLFAAAIYPDEGTLSLDYPVVRLVRSGDDPALTAALDDFEQQLRAPAARTYLADAGFRDPSGASVPGVGAAEGVVAAPIRQLNKPTTGQGVDTLRLWEAITDDVNSLLVIDVSGSMNEAGGNGKSKIDLTSEAARAAINFYPDTSNVGMWVFSTQQTATTDYRELVPIGEMDSEVGHKTRRQALIDAANSLPDQVHGNTGLYDSLLAAVRDVRKNYDPSKVNTVIFMTDGQNDNASSLTLDSLISTLKKENSPLPIPVFTIAIGPDADAAGLHKISQATGGKGYVVKDPTTIRSVFLDAVVQRQCGPSC